jgi:hypothetical protein
MVGTTGWVAIRVRSLPRGITGAFGRRDVGHRRWGAGATPRGAVLENGKRVEAPVGTTPIYDLISPGTGLHDGSATNRSASSCS